MEIDANLPSLIDTVGWIHYKAGEYGKAIPYLRRSFKARPTDATVAYHLAAALEKHNNPERAKEVLQKAIEHVGDDADLKAKMEKLLRAVGG